MKCEKCGKTNDKEAKFCSSCGEKLEVKKKFCTNCGREVKSDEAFCAKCGHPIKRTTTFNNEKNDFYWKKLITNIFHSFKPFSLGKLIKNILNTKYTMINILEIIVYIGIFAIMGIFFGSDDNASLVFVIIPTLTAFYLGFIGLIIILISWIYQKNILVLLLTGNASLIGAIALFIFGNNLNHDVEARLDSFLSTMEANPGDEYITYATILLVISIILLGLYYFINNKRKKLS